MTNVAMSLSPTAWTASAERGTFRDYLALTKPSITLMSVIMAAGAMAWVQVGYQARGAVGLWAGALVGIAFSVMGAGALNMALEWRLDAEMARTKDRPIPAGRVTPTAGFIVGTILSVAALVVLAMTTTPLAVVMTAAAQVTYVAIYTPLKQKTSWAVVIGAFPGAAPVLIGTTALLGAFDAEGVLLFALMFVWQLPHFMAISIYRRSDYTHAGYVVAAETLGTEWTKTLIVMTTVLLVAISMMLPGLGSAGFVYASAAGIVGVWFGILAASGYAGGEPQKWARKVFLGSLVYQMVVFGALALDAVFRAMSVAS